MSDSKKTDFLDQFEIGGNFFELIEFSLLRRMPDGRIYGGIYGVNVAKVREVVHMPRINPLASSIDGVAGIFELRGIPIPAVNLNRILGDTNAPIRDDQQIIVTEFSQKRAGFIVNQTHRIRRVSWDKVLPPSSNSNSFMTGMILLENNEFLFILDLEKVLIKLESGGVNQPQMMPTQMGAMEMAQQKPVDIVVDANAPGILVVDDSKLILNTLTRALTEEGFRVKTANNGQEALCIVEEAMQGRTQDFGKIHAVITDVEMPKMDGLSFVKNLREEKKLIDLPILLHTSLDGGATKDAAKKVGANGIVVRNDISNILKYLEQFLAAEGVAIGA
ncbi:MAG: chemotaxis protein CheV [Pseudobacteriovorax sp.]|nr:chemotaxis protein CheV [Pseudobacteriovorax sp.]